MLAEIQAAEKHGTELPDQYIVDCVSLAYQIDPLEIDHYPYDTIKRLYMIYRYELSKRASSLF